MSVSEAIATDFCWFFPRMVFAMRSWSANSDSDTESGGRVSTSYFLARADQAGSHSSKNYIELMIFLLGSGDEVVRDYHVRIAYMLSRFGQSFVLGVEIRLIF